MQLMTKQSDYAIRFLLRLAQTPETWIPSRSLAEREGVPLAFARRLLVYLTKEGWIASREGAEGGCRLQISAKQIRLLDVLELFQGKLKLHACLFRNQHCPNRLHCVLRPRIQGIEQKVAQEFAAITIADLHQDQALVNRSDRTIREKQ
jgi:Rrf2 family protein